MDTLYPTENSVFMGVWFTAEFEKYPTGFPEEEVEYKNGTYILSHNIVFVGLEDKIYVQINQ